jgi:hypothetical protein
MAHAAWWAVPRTRGSLPRVRPRAPTWGLPIEGDDRTGPASGPRQWHVACRQSSATNA